MKQYIIDAFTDTIFSGNQAAVCILDEWLSDETMLLIAKENNLSETAFLVKQKIKNVYKLRWFTPGGEIDLCGHATLACAFVVMNYYEKNLKTLIFDTLSGELTVNRKNKNLYELDFPVYDLKKIEITDEIVELIGKKPIEAYLGRDLMCVFDDEEFILNANLDCKIKNKIDKIDCISRSFAPKLNIYEDPVCGSGHCHIVPYWIQKLQKENLIAYQASERSGTLYCSLTDDGRVKMNGKATLFAISEIFI